MPQIPPGDTVCHYRARGTQTHLAIKQALRDCPAEGCAVILAKGTFNITALDKDDSIFLRSNVRLQFSEGAHLDFTGSNTEDRYVIDMVGEKGLLENIYVGGPGLIAVNLGSDHGLRVLGEARNIVIGDGLRFQHKDLSISVDKGIQITGSVELQDITVRDLEISGFGWASSAAYGIDVVGLVHRSIIQRIASIKNQHAISFRGATSPITGVLQMDGLSQPVALPEASDEKPETAVPVTLGGGQVLLVGARGRYNALFVALANLNDVQGTLELSVSDGQGGWIPVELVRDGTTSGRVPLAQDGELEFAVPRDGLWKRQAMGGINAYWLRVSAPSTAVFSLAEVRAYQVPHENTVSQLPPQGPSALPSA